MGISLAMPSIAGAALHPPDINPANFTGCSVPSNPVFPLVPGTTWMYEGQSEGVPTSNTVQVTCTTKQIILENGVVTATVVHDQAFENGLLVEDTFDYFATDCTGIVWYLGEDSTQIPSGNKEGSWPAGENDADAGFIMLAAPTPGDRYYQEFARGVAEDQAKVLTLSGSASSPYTGPANNLLVTKETSRLSGCRRKQVLRGGYRVHSQRHGQRRRRVHGARELHPRHRELRSVVFRRDQRHGPEATTGFT